MKWSRLTADPENQKKLAAEMALNYIRQLYALEKEAKELMPEERCLMRQEKAKQSQSGNN
jgi:hypothetical protein